MHLVEFFSKGVISVEEGSILKYITAHYDKDRQEYGHVLQVIGDPVAGDNAGITHYTFPTSDSEYKTHIKVV